MKKIIIIIFLILLPLNVKANKELSLICDKTDKLSINEEVICRISLNSKFVYNEINFEILNTEGLQIVDVRSNYDKRWKVQKNNNNISFISNENQTDLQEFGIILIKSLKSGNQDLTLNNIILKNNTTEETKEYDGINIRLKIISSDNLLKSITINNKELDDFTSNKTNYNIIIDKETEIKIDALSNNEFANISGIGEFKLSDKVTKFIFPIIVLSEDNTSNVYTINVIRKNNQELKDTYLDNLIIKNDKGSTLLIDFKSNIYEYTIDVNQNTKYLDIKPSVNNNLTFVKNYGEQRIELKQGTNIALIKVQNEDGNILTYILNIIKPIANKSSNNYIKNLLIENYKINFSKRIKNYTLEIKPTDTYLKITPILENKNAKYVIIGNQNLKNGSVIKIEVTAENQEKTTYKINIKEMKTNYTTYVLYILLILAILYIIYKNKEKIISLFKIPKKSNSKIKPKKSNIKKTNKPKKITSTNKSKNTKVKPKKTNNSTKKKSNNAKSTRNPRNNYTKKTTKKKTNTTKKNIKKK